MIRKTVSLAIVLILAVAASSFAADGGTLQSTQGQASVRGLDLYPSYLQRDGEATVDLGGPEPEDVSVFKFGESFKVMVTTEEPFRLYYDSNGDGIPQPEEVSEGSTSDDPRTITFGSVRVLLNIGGSSVPVNARVTFFRDGIFRYGHLNPPGTHYRGTVSLNGRDYDALLFFRSVTENSSGNAKVIIDTDTDGAFDWLTDFWFPVNGGFSSGGNVLVSEAVFNGESAAVSLKPYDGPTARLEIQGAGFHRTRVSANFDVDSGLPTEFRYTEFCLAANGEQAWELPIGLYTPLEVWLRSSSDPNLFWHNRFVVPADRYRAQMEEGETATLELGGPLTQSVSVNTIIPSLMGKAFVDYGACTNQTGLKFEPMHRTATGQEDHLWKPSFEILDGSGQVILSADFEHG